MYPENDSFRLQMREVNRDEIAACGVRSLAFLYFSELFVPVSDRNDAS
jgi:hypothetical protein